ncbi:MAG TPA: hypothetical protein VMP03_14965 [Methylomirabilota bacterium]|nr:hypothetical protein [Methylomirabilota bacterium]
MGIASSVTDWLRIETDLLDRLTTMGLVRAYPGQQPRLTWTGREFVELRRSGLYHIVATSHATRFCL